MKANELLPEWEKDNNPFFPNTMRYDRLDLINFANWYAEKLGYSSNENNKPFVIPVVSNSVCDHYFAAYFDSNGKICYKDCEFCGEVKHTDC